MDNNPLDLAPQTRTAVDDYLGCASTSTRSRRTFNISQPKRAPIKSAAHMSSSRSTYSRATAAATATATANGARSRLVRGSKSNAMKLVNSQKNTSPSSSTFISTQRRQDVAMSGTNFQNGQRGLTGAAGNRSSGSSRKRNRKDSQSIAITFPKSSSMIGSILSTGYHNPPSISLSVLQPTSVSVKDGNFNAIEIFSLNENSDLLRWPLLPPAKEKCTSTSTSTTDKAHLDILHRLKNSMDDGQNIIEVESSSSSSSSSIQGAKHNSDGMLNGISSQSVMSMLFLMKAGLALTSTTTSTIENYDEHHKSNEDLSTCIRFFIVPLSPTRGRLVDLYPRNSSDGDDGNQILQDAQVKRSKTDMIGVSNDKPGDKVDSTTKYNEASKERGAITADDTISHQQKNGEKQTTLESLNTKELYALCISCQDKNDPKPLHFVKSNFYSAIMTIWAGGKNLEPHDHYTSEEKISMLPNILKILRDPPVNNDGAECELLLKSKSELLNEIRNRPKPKAYISDPVDNNQGDGDGEERTRNEQRDKHLRIILLQVLMRFELFRLYNDDDTLQDNFFKTYSQLGLKPDKKSKKKKKKRKTKITYLDFIEEICSLTEAASFILAGSESFKTFVNERIISPYTATSASCIAVKIADFFEIEVTTNEDSMHSLGTDENSNGKVQLSKTKEESKSPIDDVSRWNVVSSASGKQPDASTKQDENKEEPLKSPLTSLNKSEDEVLSFKPSGTSIIKSNRRNPLLADNKGRYVGRQIGNNSYREVKISRTTAKTKKAAFITKPYQTTRTTPVKKKGPTTTSSPFRASLGGAAASLRQKPRHKMLKRPRVLHNDSPTSKRHRHASVMAAVAGLRKKK